MAVFLHIQDYNRRQLRKQRVFRDRVHPLDAYDDTELKARYRLSRPMIMEIYDHIGIDIEPQTNRNHAIPGMLQIFCTLRYYACGSFQTVVGDGLGIHRSTVSRIIARVTTALCQLKNRYIKFPSLRNELQETKEQFHAVARMPNVVGAIDGTLISITAPREQEHLYVSGRKGGHSLNVLAVVNSQLKFTYIVAKYPGSTNDAYIWNNCRLYDLFEAGQFNESWLLGDSG